jgi:hypothetical protein
VLTFAVIALAAVWIGALIVIVGLCASAAHGDRNALSSRQVACVPRGRFLRTAAR